MKIHQLCLTLTLALTTLAFGQAKITEGNKKLPLKGESFKLNGHDAFIILPEKVDGETPWCG